MLEIKIDAPDLAAAICKLAAAIAPHDINTLTPDEPMGIPAAAPVAPVADSAPAAPVSPTPAPVAPVAAPVAPTAPAPTAPVPTAPVPTEQPADAPVAHAPDAAPVNAPTYTVDQIARAGASLVDAGKMEQLLTLLARYGVAAVTQLKPDQFGAFATELRALGAQI